MARKLVRKAQADCVVGVDGNAYSVSWRRIGESVRVVIAGEQLRISRTGGGTARCPPIPINNGNWRGRELDFFEPR